MLTDADQGLSCEYDILYGSVKLPLCSGSWDVICSVADSSNPVHISFDRTSDRSHSVNSESKADTLSPTATVWFYYTTYVLLSSLAYFLQIFSFSTNPSEYSRAVFLQFFYSFQ